MSLKTYELSDDRKSGGNEFVHAESCVLCEEYFTGCINLAPGEWVKHRTFGGFGIIVGMDGENLTILWSQEPSELGGFNKFVMPIVRRQFNYPAIARQIVQIQPMTVPRGGIFYLDFKYGEELELDKKCNEGALLSKMYWRARRSIKCFKTRIQSSLQSLLLSLRSALPSRSPSTSSDTASQSNPHQYLLEKWNRKKGMLLPPSGAPDEAKDAHESLQK